MLLKKEAFLWITLCSILFCASIPVLVGVSLGPTSIFSSPDIVVLTQSSRDTPLDVNLAYGLGEQDFITNVSPEIYAFTSTVNAHTGVEEPILVRGVLPESFLELERGYVFSGNYYSNESFILLGEVLSERLGYGVGDRMTITGSLNPAFFEVTVTGIYRAETSVDDEMLVPLDLSRKMAGLTTNSILSIRIRTTDYGALNSYLIQNILNVDIGGGDSGTGTNGGTTDGNTSYEQEVAQDLALKYFKPSHLNETSDSFISTFIQKGSGSIGIVITGFIVLNAVLIFMGISSIFLRGLIERRHDLGVLSAIGASKLNIQILLFKDILLMSLLATGIGVTVGVATAYFISESNLLLAFGHVVRPIINLDLVLIMVAASMAIAVSSGVLGTAWQLSKAPQDLIHGRDVLQPEGDMDGLVSLLEVSS